MHRVARAFLRAVPIKGNRIAIKRAIIPMTINNSTNENARCCLVIALIETFLNCVSCERFLPLAHLLCLCHGKSVPGCRLSGAAQATSTAAVAAGLGRAAPARYPAGAGRGA